MTETDQRRLLILGEIDRGLVQVAEAASVLALSERQVQRLLAAYRKEGAAALVHGNRGRQPAHTVGDAMRERVVTLARGTYAGCNQVHFTELLAEREGIVLSRATVRRILAEAQVPSPRTRRAPRHRSRRERYPQAGMLVQLDGSPHAWLEARGPRLCLHAGIDDATGEVVGAVFRPTEDSAGYLTLLEHIVQQYGRPLALYHDRHGIFGRDPVRNRYSAQQQGQRRDPTQVERAMQELGIASIAARSPQAKGRIERLFGSLQDRLVTELRLAQITTCADANTFVSHFVPRYNARFAVPAAISGSAYRPLEPASIPDHIFCFKYVRTVAADNTVQLEDHRLQLLPGPTRLSYAKCRVEVYEHLDGRITVWYQDACLATRAAPPEAPVIRARTGHRGSAASTQPCGEDRPALSPPSATAPPRPIRTARKPAPTHPWRQSFTLPPAQASRTTR